MKNLEKKYRENELNLNELYELRKAVSELSDAEVAESLQKAWMEEDIDTSCVEQAQLHKMKTNIDRAIGFDKSSRHLYFKVAQIAAAILLPVFILTTYYLYNENNQLAAEMMIVSTAKGERANIELPDGTRVMLNAESKLSYSPRAYNKKERKIDFEGEGYFQVYKNKECPFAITARGMKVEVLGTTFNLRVRQMDTTAELSLEEGSVALSSLLSRQNVILKPGEKAVLNQKSGQITVIKDENILKNSAWRRGELVFYNVNLSHVIKEVENNYNIHITIDCKECFDDLFTGTLPIQNISEVLSILEKTYYLKATMEGDQVRFTKLGK